MRNHPAIVVKCDGVTTRIIVILRYSISESENFHEKLICISRKERRRGGCRYRAGTTLRCSFFSWVAIISSGKKWQKTETVDMWIPAMTPKFAVGRDPRLRKTCQTRCVALPQQFMRKKYQNQCCQMKISKIRVSAIFKIGTFCQKSIRKQYGYQIKGIAHSQAVCIHKPSVYLNSWHVSRGKEIGIHYGAQGWKKSRVVVP